MPRILFVFLLATFSLQAQTKKPVSKPTATATPSADTTVKAPEPEKPLPREFMVYSKKKKGERTKLCINLVSADTVLNHCINDSVCRDPEVYKILFERKDADSTFALIYIQAFSKPVDRPACDYGKEVKLIFVRWNTQTNKAVVKQKNIESCMKNITNMTKEPIPNWDGSSPLTINYFKGGSGFLELRFDPEQYRKGLQGSDD